MKLEIIESDSNYVATIVRLPELKKVEGLDNLMLANVFGYGCLVGKDSKSDGLFVFFPAECVIDNEFLKSNNSYRKSELNMDKDVKGFFEESGRVKAVKFKGVVSSGFLTPISFLGTIADGLKEGDTFHSIDGYNICKKYRSLETVRKEKILAKQGIKQPKYDRVIPTQFRLHSSTPQFLRFISDFKEGDKIVITEKLHGTSAVFSNVLTKRKLNLIERMARYVGCDVRDTEYYPLYSSRTVIKNKDVNLSVGGGFYGEDVWGEWAKKLEGKIEKGITVYGEIVGFTASGQFIQKGYSYGCAPKESKFYVYRMTYTTPDGVAIEFTDSQIRQYCELRDILVVPLITIPMDRLYKSANRFEQIAEYFSKEIEVMCPMNYGKVPREGVVIRRDGMETFSAYKLKSQLFLTNETKEIDNGTVDTEEAN